MHYILESDSEYPGGRSEKRFGFRPIFEYFFISGLRLDLVIELLVQGLTIS